MGIYEVGSLDVRAVEIGADNWNRTSGLRRGGGKEQVHV